MLSKIVKNIAFFNKVSPARACLLKADGLFEYKHYKEALIEAEKARDTDGANVYEVEIAKGKIVDILKKMKENKDEIPQVTHKNFG